MLRQNRRGPSNCRRLGATIRLVKLDRRLDHAAFLTWDTEATHDFYVGVMGWPLVVAWGREGGDQPFFITGYDAGGWVIEFEEMVGLPRAEPAPAPAFPHFGFIAESEAAVSAWAAHLHGHGVANMTVGESVYWTDPNAVTFQLFYPTEDHGSREERIARSERNLEAWLARTEAHRLRPGAAPPTSAPPSSRAPAAATSHHRRRGKGTQRPKALRTPTRAGDAATGRLRKPPNSRQ